MLLNYPGFIKLRKVLKAQLFFNYTWSNGNILHKNKSLY